MADDFWSGLGGLLGGGSSDLYGDLLTDKQRQALLFKEIGGGLDEISKRAAEAGKPSLMPGGKGWLGSALSGYGAGANAAGEGMLKTLQTAQALRKAKRDQELTEQYFLPLLRDLTAKEKQHGLPPGSLTSTIQPPTAGAPATPTAPPGTAPPGPGYGGPTNAELGAPPLAAPPTNAELGAPPLAAAGGDTRGLPASPLAGGPPTPAERLEWQKTVGPGGPYLPLGDWVAQKRSGQQSPPPPPPLKTTEADPSSQFAGLLSGASPGGLDQLVGPDGQPLTGQGVLPSMLASYGGAPGGMPPFQLAAATPTSGTTPGAAGGADILDTVVAPLESGNRNIHQRVTSPSVSSAQGYYQITNSTWKDTAPKAGVDLNKFPTAMSAPREVQKQVAQKLYDERGLQPWADFNPAVAAATGYRRGGRFAGAGPDAGRIPAGGGDQMQAISALLRLTGDNGEADPLASLPSLTDSGAPDTLIPSPGGSAGLPVRQATAALAPYATGNARLGGPSSVEGVGAGMSGKIEAMVQAMPPDVRERFLITSGFRDAQRQAQVNPGVTNSRHMHGAAVDLAKDPVVLDWINKNPQYGLGFPLQADPKEINHLEMINAGGGRDTVIPSGRGIPASALTNVADTSTTPGTGTAPGGGNIPGTNMTPQGLAALNAMSKLLGHGDMFGSLLETYYKSPNYLTEAARARAAGENDPLIIEQKKRTEYKIDTELKPGLEAAVAQAMNAPLKDRAQAQAEIDRRTKELEQLGAAGTRIGKATVVGDDGKPVEKNMTDLEVAIREKLAAQRRANKDFTVRPGDIIGTPVLTPEQTAEQTERGKAPYAVDTLTLTWPDGETRKVQVTGEQRKNILEGRPEPAVGWPGTTGGASPDGTGATTGGGRVGETVYPPGYAEATTVMLKERRPKAEAAVQSLNFNETAQRLLDAGIISGYGASFRLDVAKAKALFGWSNDQIANTEAFLATQARQVAANLASGAFGSGASITDNDRRYAATMTGADSNLDEKSLRFLIRQNDTAARWEIDRYKADVKRHDPKGRLPILDITVPEKAEAKPSANQPKIVGSQQLGGKTYHKWSDGQWRPEGEIP